MPMEAAMSPSHILASKQIMMSSPKKSEYSHMPVISNGKGGSTTLMQQEGSGIVV